jgi:hypothetical protein
MYVYRKFFVFLHECMSASVGNTINHALPRLHDIEAISRDRIVERLISSLFIGRNQKLVLYFD